MSELIDNRRHRIQTLKEVIRHLHQGGSADEVRERLKTMVRETDATEIAAMEQELISEGMPVEEVQSMCDLHSSVLREVIVETREEQVVPGHPVDTLRRENRALEQAIEAARSAAAAGDVEALKLAHRDLSGVEKHYRRKENLLFSVLERHGITGPSKVMWGKDDEVREKLKAIDVALAAEAGPEGGWAELVEPALTALTEMITKEEKILIPLSLATLTAEEWGEVWEQSPEYGYCIVDPETGYRPPVPEEPAETVAMPQGKSMIMPSGALNAQELLGIFSTLPVDITFVDADDRVRFFSEGPERVFARSKAVIGRKVQHCHPPKSVDIVDRILEDFRAGRQRIAEFWIQLHGKFLHIRYFAVNDEAGAYLGTLEVTQDITRLRQLEGDRRLLQYDDEPTAPVPEPV